jgi:hypothetical protein
MEIDSIRQVAIASISATVGAGAGTRDGKYCGDGA